MELKKKQKPEKRERYQITLLPSVQANAAKKAKNQRKSFSRLVENLLYDYSAE